MRPSLNLMIWWLASLCWCGGVRAITPNAPTNRYRAIQERNAFALRPADAPAKPEAPPPTISKLILTGITTILGDKRVLLKQQPQAVPPGGQPKEESLILAEGQREAGVEVLAIDERAGSVRVNNAGTPMTLTFEKDGVKTPRTPPPPPAAVTPGATSPPPAPLTNPQTNGANFSPGRHLLPTRIPRLPAANASAAAATLVPAVSTNLAPTGAATGTAYPAPDPTAPQAQPLPQRSLEDQLLLLEVQRALRESNTAQVPPASTLAVPGSLLPPPMLPGTGPTATPVPPPTQYAPQ